jgi:hypothetical protein
MDLTSLPGSPWNITPRHVKESRISLAKSADLLRIEGKFIPAEKLYLRASSYAEGMAAVHLIKLADHCRTEFLRIKKLKAKKSTSTKGARR